MKRKILFAAIAIIVLIQFIQPQKNNAVGPQPNAIATKYAVPTEVSKILTVACNDCHSNKTVYPWYSNIQPLGWWLTYHVNDGKKHFNLDEFTTYTLKRQEHKLEELVESQDDHWMPLDSYTWIHKEARLTDAQRKVLVDWANQTRKQIQADPNFIASSKEN
jgi:hypothetical protein